MLLVLIGFSTLIFSCKKDDDNEPPTFTSVDIARVDTMKVTATITFSEGVYGNSNKTGNLDYSDLKLTLWIYGTEDPDTTIFALLSMEHTAGENTAILNLDVYTSPVVDKKLMVKPADGNCIFDANGEPMKDTGEIESDMF